MSDLRVRFPKPCGERWEEMTPRGCNRHCASCDTVIHDLSRMTYDEVEALLAADSQLCVRARISSDGVFKLRHSVNARRMVMAVGSSISLATAACQTGNFPPRASIVGQLSDSAVAVRVRARGADGSSHRAKVNPDGTFEIKNLYYGVYSLIFSDFCGEKTKIATLVVNASKVDAGNIEYEEQCIVVGMLEIDNQEG